MPSPFRPFLCTLLCCVIVLGQALAWSHVGTCQSHATLRAGVEKTVSVCSHGCRHHASSPDAAQAASEPDRSDNHRHHDSDTCVICQSLASPNGVTWELQVSLPAEFVSQPAFVAAQPLLTATLLPIPPPRGPPVAA